MTIDSKINNKRKRDEIIENSDPSQNPSKILKVNSDLNIEFGSYSDKGNKTHNEDRFLLLQDLSLLAKESQIDLFKKNKYSFFAIYDGHGGHFVSTYLHEHFHFNLIEELALKYSKLSEDEVLNLSNTDSKIHQDFIKNSLFCAFYRTEKEIQELLKDKLLQEGSTAAIGLLVDNVLQNANIGDTKIILVRQKSNGKQKVVSLSKEHHPILLEERKRIEKSGGFVEEGRVLSRLEVSRSFGDPEFKSVGVISNPYISRIVLPNIQHNLMFFVIGCDGLQSHFPQTDVGNFVNKTLNHYTRPDVSTVARKLVCEAIMERGAADNVTSIIGVFNMHLLND